MAKAIIEHDCEFCALHKRYVEGIKVEEDDKKAFERINVIVTNAEQAASPDSIQSLPADTSDDNKEIYVLSAMKEEDDAQLLIRDWWILMQEKYPIPSSVKFDNVLSKFYECVDKDDNVSLDGNFIPKDAEDMAASKGNTVAVNDNHDCAFCALHKRFIDITVATEDKLSFERISVIYANAEKRVAAISNLSSTIKKEDRMIWATAARERFKQAQLLIRDWWIEMKEKYPIPDSSKYDNVENKFYECVDENGVASMDGEFVPKAAN